MLGYSVLQFFHPTHRMMTKERGHTPVFTTPRLSQAFEEPFQFIEEEEFLDDKDSGTSEEGPSDAIHCFSGFLPTAELFQNPTRQQIENHDIELVSLLTLCAESISTSNHAAINCFLSRLGELACPRGTPIQRLVAYFTEALALRVVKLWPNVFSISPPIEVSDQINTDDDCIALRLLNQVSPIPKFLHFTLNERLLGAFEGKERVHIIDFDINEGLQWPSLFQSLASRRDPPTHLRITAMGDSKQDLQDKGVRLKGLAESFNFQFQYHPVVDRLEDVRLWMLHVKEGECVVVNCVALLHKALYDDDSQGALMNLLGMIRRTNPSLLLLAEEEAEHNDPIWEMRFANSLKYYGAIFDSLDSSFWQEDGMSRIKIEEMFAQRIRNIVAPEGMERVERHEKFEKWREILEEGGFRCSDFGEREENQSKMLLKMYSTREQHYSIEKREGALTLKWFDQPLYTVSAWAPTRFSGSSPASSHSG